MPPSTNTNSRKKRTLAEADPNAKTSGSKSKKNATDQQVESTTKSKPDKSKGGNRTSKAPSTAGKKKTARGSKASNRSDASENTNTDNQHGDTVATEEQSVPNAVERAQSPSEVPPRARYGPNGELFVPNVLPLEAMNPGIKSKIYPPSCAGIDGIPGRPMTTGNEKWWAENREWLEKNAKAIKFDEKAWRKKAADTKAKDKPSAKEKKEGEEADRRALEHEKKKGREDFDWVCICRPAFDAEEEDVDDDDSEGGGGGHPCGTNCVSGELTRYHPDNKFVVTVRGADRIAFWVQEMMKRDQDDFDMHINNDFSGYGIIEVIQNQILAFDKAIKREVGLAVWAELESMAYFLNQDLHPLMMCDDSEGIRATIEVIGHAVLNTIALIIEQGEFKPNSKVKNLGLILALFIRFVCKVWEGWDPSEEQTQWVGNLVALADEHKVDLNVLSSLEGNLEELRDANDDREDDLEFGKPLDTGKPWDGVLKDYTKNHAPAGGKGKPSIGGTHYDITRMSTTDKKRYNLGGGGGLKFSY